MNRKVILWIGAVVVLVNIIPLLLTKVAPLEFYLLNVLCLGIIICALWLNLKDIFTRLYVPLLVLSFIMGLLNLLFIPKNIMLSLFNLIFWIFYLLFLYRNKKAQT